ncbi:MAG: hypothetical protein R3193_09145 [Marinobacter sp.]|nr:hypothetical protein [Marinobacter sp.]
MSEAKCTCKWNPDGHDDDCPLFLKDKNTRLQSEVERLRGRCGELMDFCADKIGRLPLPDDRTDFANGRYTAFHEVYVEAQRLRQQAAESENE